MESSAPQLWRCIDLVSAVTHAVQLPAWFSWLATAAARRAPDTVQELRFDILSWNHMLSHDDGLAEALQQCWVLPEQVAAARLEAAQALATRSCANLGLEGGPAVGEAGGSLRCAACRSVWYCGIICSHADWWAGHKRVCKAMAAARRQALQAAAADRT